MARPVIALLTDFGTSDAYVASMKGVILSIAPDVTLVDLSHEIPPHDVRTGARLLGDCHAYYPPGTIFVAVVDPGVGSARRALAVDTGDYRLVGPDNGVLGVVLDRHPPKRIVELTERKYQRPTVSRTFDGRDRFAPAAGWLAKGVAITLLGRGVSGYERLDWPAAAADAGGLTGEVEVVDRFGNLITNIERAEVDRLLRDGAIDVGIDGQPVDRLVATYAEAGAGEVCALFGSTDRLEIALNGGSAARRFAKGAGTPVTVRRRAV
ncbi:MAG: S-adenosyl-l-methionine hydroxide adenosyltransferase family protein [Vicinamibacterales bacterium]